MALKVVQQHGAAGDTRELPEQRDHFGVREMMQEECAENKIHTAVAERQLKSIAADTRPCSPAQVTEAAIERYDVSAGIRTGGQHAVVPRSRADVEECEFLRWPSHLRQHLQQQRMAAQPAIDADQIVEIRGSLGFRSIVEQFRPDQAGTQTRHLPMIRASQDWQAGLRSDTAESGMTTGKAVSVTRPEATKS